MPAGVIETGAVVETMPVNGAGMETSARPIEIKETAPTAPAAAPAKPSPAKPTRARDRMFADLEKKSGITAPEETAPPPVEDKKSKPETKRAETETKPDDTETETDVVETDSKDSPVPEEAAPTADEKGKRQSPWKVVDTYKQRNKALEKEIAELRSRITPENDLKALNERLQNAESALKEREDFIRLHKYQQSEEFKEKFQKPYEQAWLKAAKYMSEISVMDPYNGAERPATVKDMEQLVNAPLGRARKLAEELFGGYANDAMTMREKIIELYDQQTEAIEKVKQEGAKREQIENEKRTRESEQLKQEFGKHWLKSNEQLLADEKWGVYFKPREGDEEWNKRLAKATEMIDKAFATMRPHITDRGQVEEAIKLHAVMRHRAIAFGPLRYENEMLKKDRDAWKAKYEAIAKSAPPAGQGAERGAKPNEPVRARDRMFADLERRAGV